MSLHWDQLNAQERVYREAEERGMADYDRGLTRQQNPFDKAQAPRQWAAWDFGYTNAQDLDRRGD